MARLDDKVAEAIAAINSLFPGMTSGDKTSSGFYIYNTELSKLVETYERFLGIDDIIGSFESASRTVRRMRSPHLPTEMHQPRPINNAATLGGSQPQESQSFHFIEDDLTEKESYENAFMRMLGMPMDTDLSGATSGSADEIYTIDPNEQIGTKKTVGYPHILENVLDVRQNHEAREREADDIFRTFFDINTVNIDGTEYTDDDVGDVIRARESIEAVREQIGEITGTTAADEEARARGETQIEDTLAEMGEEGSPKRVLYSKLFDSGMPPAAGSILEDIQELNDAAVREGRSAVGDIVGYMNEKVGGYRLTNLNQNFFRLKRLMTPPVQDSRISRCISDVEKLVARPFSHPVSRVVSGSSTRASLLETVIRIRFDRASGTGSFVGASASAEVSDQVTSSGIMGSDITASGQDDGGAVGLTSESFGALEALLIVRLRASIQAFAKKYKDITEDIIVLMTADNASIDTSRGRSDIGTANETPSVGVLTEWSGTQTVDGADAIEIYKKQKLLEESVLTMFGETDKVPGLSSAVQNTPNVLDLQVGTVRTSSITQGHLVDPVLSVVSLPLKNINSKLNSIRREAEERGAETERHIADLQSMIGLPNGIGAIDVAVYTLALFTLPEVYLLGLLDNTSFELLMNGSNRLLYAAALRGNLNGQKPSTTASVNALSELVISGYELFRRELENDE